MRCPQCKKPATSGAPFCSHCGTPLNASVSPPKGDDSTDPKTWLIGRDPECDIVLENSRVSQHHASLGRTADGSLRLTDLNSSNGTFLNSPTNRIQSSKVSPTDIVYFADEKRQVAQILDMAYKAVPTPDPDPAPAPKPDPAPDQKPDSISVSPPLPALQKMPIWKYVLQSWFFLPGILTVACVCALFSLLKEEGGTTPLYSKILASYIATMSALFIVRLGRRSKPLPVLILVGAFVFFALESPLINVFVYFFREILPGHDLGEGLFNTFIQSLFGAGLMEELFKAIPVLIGVLIFFTAPTPWNSRCGVRDSLDGLIFGVCAGLGFTLNETLFNHMYGYYSNFINLLIEAAGGKPLALALLAPDSFDFLIQTLEKTGGMLTQLTDEQLMQINKIIKLSGGDTKQFIALAQSESPVFFHATLRLMIPRVLSALAGHSAYAGCLGYFIGQAVKDRKNVPMTILKGYFLASVLHALWNTLADVNMWLGFTVSLISLFLLLFLITKARQDAGIPLTISRPTFNRP